MSCSAKKSCERIEPETKRATFTTEIERTNPIGLESPRCVTNLGNSGCDERDVEFGLDNMSVRSATPSVGAESSELPDVGVLANTRRREGEDRWVGTTKKSGRVLRMKTAPVIAGGARSHGEAAAVAKIVVKRAAALEPPGAGRSRESTDQSASGRQPVVVLN